MGLVVVEAGVIAEYVTAWAVRKARRAGGRLDGEADAAIDAGLDRLYEVVAATLGAHPVLADLDEEAAGEQGQVSERTRQQVELAVTAAAGKDEVFERVVTDLVAQVRAVEQATGQSPSGQGVDIAADVDIHAHHRSAAAWSTEMVDSGRTAGTITDPDLQAWAQALVVGALAQAGQHDQAEQVADTITDPDLQALALTQVAGALAQAGRHDQAEQVPGTITDPDWQTRALTRVVDALTRVAGALAGAGQYDQAEQVAAQAEQIARTITSPNRQAQA